MADQSPNTKDFDYSDAEVRRGVELLYFGYSHLTRAADDRLAQHGLGRAHHRALYFIARQPGLMVSDLLALLNVTKQSLGRVINDLTRLGHIRTETGALDRRQRRLHLTENGRAFEASLFADLRAKLSGAYGEAGAESHPGFWAVLEGLIPEDVRARVIGLR